MKNGKVAHYFRNKAHGEDAWLTRTLSSTSVLDVVFDGMTADDGLGRNASRFAKQQFCDQKNLNRQKVKRILDETNEKLVQKYRENAGTTVAASLKCGSRLYLFNAGDSHIYLIRDQKTRELTTSDRDPNRSDTITNWLGKEEYQLHMSSVVLRPRDRIVLATDGILDNIAIREERNSAAARLLRDNELQTTVMQYANAPARAIELLKEFMTFKRKNNTGYVFGDFKDDDATAIVRFLYQSKHRRTYKAAL